MEKAGRAAMLGIVIPVRNEEEGVGRLLVALRRAHPSAAICVVDGGSSDRSRQIVSRIAAGDPDVHLLTQEANGFAYGLRQGLEWAWRRGLDPIVQMDADGSHPPGAVATLLAALDYADVAVGSRFVAGSRTPGLPLIRRILSRSAAILLGLGFGLPLRDPTGGFKAWRACALAAVLRPAPVAHGFFVQAELNLWAFWRRLRLVEVPFTFLERQGGRSSMDLAKILDALRATARMWRMPTARAGRARRLRWRVLALAGELAVFNGVWWAMGSDPLAMITAVVAAPGGAAAFQRCSNRAVVRTWLLGEILGALPVAGVLALAAGRADLVAINLLRLLLMPLSRGLVQRLLAPAVTIRRVRPSGPDAIAGDA